MAAEQIGMIIGTLFLARDVTHKEHLKTKSYAQHMALGGFYGAIIDLADSLAESYQGRFGKLIDIPLMAHKETGNVQEFLASQLEWIHGTRYQAVPKDESAIQNIIDEIEALYMATIYKLKFLS